MQNWLRLYHYPSEFLELVYRYYAAHGVAYICTYYHLDIPRSIADVSVLDAASYHEVGDLSGLTWEKITLFPIYNTDQIQPTFMGEERGFGKFDQISGFNFPEIYGLVPTTHDHVFFEELVLNNDRQPVNHAMYRVKNFEKATNTFVTFWKVSLKVDWKTKTQIEDHVFRVYSFFDYEKRIYPLDTATSLYTLLEKNEALGHNNFFKDTVGYYFGT